MRNGFCRATIPECNTSIELRSTICAASSTTTHDGFLPSPDFFVSRDNALNIDCKSPRLPIVYLLGVNKSAKSLGMASIKPFAASNTIVACSRFVASVKTSAPVSPQSNSYKVITAVSVDLPALRGINSITSVTIRLVKSFLLRKPYIAHNKRIWNGSKSIGSPAWGPLVCTSVDANCNT